MVVFSSAHSVVSLSGNISPTLPCQRFVCCLFRRRCVSRRYAVVRHSPRQPQPAVMIDRRWNCSACTYNGRMISLAPICTLLNECKCRRALETATASSCSCLLHKRSLIRCCACESWQHAVSSRSDETLMCGSTEVHIQPTSREHRVSMLDHKSALYFSLVRS